jgi:hypothetical protein
MKKLLSIFLFTFATQAATGFFALPETGIVPTQFDLEGKFYAQPEVNVLAFGADTNGVTDSRTAFVNAMATLPVGGVLRVPRGTYKFATAWTLAKSDYTVIGNGAKLKYAPGAKTANFLILQGSRYKWQGIDFDGNKLTATTVYVDNATGGAGAPSFKGNTFEGAYADDVNDPSQTTEVSLLTIKRGNQNWEVIGNVFTNSTCAVAGTRTCAGMLVTDFGYSVAADANLGGVVRDNWFATIQPGGFGDAIRMSLTQNYDAGHQVVNNHFGTGIGFRAVKLICNGVGVRGNWMHGDDSNARAGISDYGDNNHVEGNDILGLYTYGIEGGSNLGNTVSHGMWVNNHIRFEGAAKTTGIGIRGLYNVQGCLISGNSITDAARAIYADGKFYANLISDTCATNIVNNAIEFATDGSNAPSNCQVVNTIIQGGGGNGVSFTAGTNLFCGMVVGPPAGQLVNWSAGVTGNRVVEIYGDGFWADWNGMPLVGAGIWDECISQSLAGGIGFLASTLNSGVAGVSTILAANHNGLYAVTTGGTVNGVGNIRTSGNHMLFGSRKLRLIYCIHTPAALSSATDIYQIWEGFGDSTTAANVDGAWITYTHTLNSGNWTGQTSAASSVTTMTTDSNVAYTANADWWIGIEGNSSLVSFFVAPDNNGGPGTWVKIGHCVANIPTAGSFGLIHQIIKQGGSVGTATESCYLDKVIYNP